MKNLRLKSARAAKDLSQQQLADLGGVSRQTMAAGEKGDCAWRSARRWTRPWTSCSGRNNAEGRFPEGSRPFQQICFKISRRRRRMIRFSSREI